jgi:hypothetical protein
VNFYRLENAIIYERRQAAINTDSDEYWVARDETDAALEELVAENSATKLRQVLNDEDAEHGEPTVTWDILLHGKG